MSDETIDLVLAGDNLGDEQAAELELRLEEDPNDLASRLMLLGFYASRSQAEDKATALFKHASWLVEHHPKHEIHQNPYTQQFAVRQSPQRYEQMKALWLTHFDNFAGDIDVVKNAAYFFTRPEIDFAQALLLRAKLLAPDDRSIDDSLRGIQFTLDQRKLAKALQHGHCMTAEQAMALEQEVEADSSNFDARVRLLSYYRPRRRGSSSIIKERLKHVAWLIENTPRHRIHHAPCPLTSVRPDVDGPEQYRQVKSIWLRQVELSPCEITILLNAACFFLLDDFDLSEQLVLRAKDIAPDDFQVGVDLEFVNYLTANPEQKLVIGP